jgi:mitogen-activated protein kinase 1/3
MFVFFLCTAKPGRVVGPVLPYEDLRSIKDEYGSRMYDRNAVPTPQAVTAQWFLKTHTVNREKSGLEEERDLSQAKPQQCNTTAKPASGMAMDANANPYIQSQAKGDQLNERITIDAKLLHAQSQFGAAGAAAVAVAAHRNAGAVKYGLS